MENMTISDWILVATAFVIFLYTCATFWYASETRQMKKEMIKQNELALMPAIIMYNDGDDFYIKNIGKGPALNILIKDITSVEEKIIIEGEEKIIQIKCRKTPSLIPGEKEKLECKTYICGIEKDYLPAEPALNPKFATTNFNVEIEYTNINGVDYQSSIMTGKDGIKIKKIQKIKS
jgi:hypothetical protein